MAKIIVNLNELVAMNGQIKRRIHVDFDNGRKSDPVFRTSRNHIVKPKDRGLPEVVEASTVMYPLGKENHVEELEGRPFLINFNSKNYFYLLQLFLFFSYFTK